MRYGIVIPVGPGRQENVLRCLRSIARGSVIPREVALVLDGLDVEHPSLRGDWPFALTSYRVEHHEPGMEQPRNIGVRCLREVDAETTHVWFLDSDIIVDERALESFIEAREIAGEDAIQIGPYEWMPAGRLEALPELQNDPRWPSFVVHPPNYLSQGKLNDGLACWSGNLVWSVAEFERIGGFWNEIHHGRCEDGELGLRAVAQGVPIQFVAEARGWHVDHPRNMGEILRRNARDVPMLNARHPWVQAGGLVVVDRDGRRFDQRCPNCSELVNTGDYWNHAAACGAPMSGPRVLS